MKKGKKKGNHGDDRIFEHRNIILKVDLANAKRQRDECKRQKNDWRNAAQLLAGIFQKQKPIPRDAKHIIKNFPKC
jgi:hypothetical protein